MSSKCSPSFRFQTRVCMHFSSLLCLTCFSHFILRYLATLIIYSEFYKNPDLIERFRRTFSPMGMDQNYMITANDSIVCLQVPELCVRARRVRACDRRKNKIPLQCPKRPCPSSEFISMFFPDLLYHTAPLRVVENVLYACEKGLKGSARIVSVSPLN
jgi:hypothetical protein